MVVVSVARQNVVDTHETEVNAVVAIPLADIVQVEPLKIHAWPWLGKGSWNATDPTATQKVLETHETALKMVDSEFAWSEPQVVPFHTAQPDEAPSSSTGPLRTAMQKVEETHDTSCTLLDQKLPIPSSKLALNTVLPLHEVPFQCSAASASTPMHDVAEPQLSATNATCESGSTTVGAVHVAPLNVAASVRFTSAQNVADAQDTYDASSAVRPDQLVPLNDAACPRRR